MGFFDSKKLGIFSSSIFVAGYTIGTAFLIIPAAAGPTGFWPPALVSLLICLFMLGTALLFLEVILAHPPGTGFVTTCRNLIGPSGAVLGGLTFCIIMFYFLAASCESSALFIQKLLYGNQKSNPSFFIYLLLLIVFSFIVFCGYYVCNRVNLILFLAMLGTAFAAIFVGFKDLSLKSSVSKDWNLIFFGVPVILTTFDFHAFIPSLSCMLQKNGKKIVYSLVIGLAITLAYYLIWTKAMLSWSTPAELWEGFENGWITVEDLKPANSRSFLSFFYLMTIFASLTSIMGAGLVFVDFFSDALKIPMQDMKGWKRYILCLAVFSPAMIVGWSFPAIFTAYFPSFFIGFCEVFFICILPIWLVVKQRYVNNTNFPHYLFGGKPMLFLFAFLTFILVYLEGIQFFLKL